MALSAKERRDLYKKEMDARHKESFNSKDDTGRFKSIYDPSKKSGISFWKPKEDDHEISIVPYVTGKMDPKLREGSSAIVLIVFVHRGVGVNEDSYICLNRTYGERCPICEHQKELRDDDTADDETIKALNPTKRAIYNIVCMDSPKETAKGVQVWDVSHYLFTVPLEEQAHKKKGGGEVPYAHHEKGKLISYRQKGTKRSLEFTAFEFGDREPLSDEILEGAYCLDELLYKPTYQEVHDAFWAGPEEKESHREEEAPPRAPKSTEPEDVPEEVTQEPPPRKSLTKSRGEEKPAEEKKKFTDCPNGAAFGKDFNEYEECRPCEARSDCRAKKDELEAPPQEEPAKPERKVLTRRGK